MTLLSVRGISKSFGAVAAVSNIDFDLACGEILALIGPNGAGKSTCFNMLGGQLRPDRGSIRLQGRELAGLTSREVWQQGVGRTFQITETFASMTVAENVQMALISFHRASRRLWSRARDLWRDDALALLARVGMDGQAQRNCGVLAYGDLKRVELAIALAGRPRLLLMDEPTAGMAPQERIALMALTSEIVRERQIGVLFTEHDMDVVFAHADRIIVMHRGRLIAEGSPAQVRENQEVREVYLGAEA
ncbi:MAG: ABC transporter ATP-binding protein [Alphaproteobacteria bacterium]|nr:ABC transporter ATP-binding protein [Alphaproteobacteria bacterium]